MVNEELIFRRGSGKNQETTVRTRCGILGRSTWRSLTQTVRERLVHDSSRAGHR